MSSILGNLTANQWQEVKGRGLGFYDVTTHHLAVLDLEKIKPFENGLFSLLKTYVIPKKD